ncbi:MAG: hypothetical protein WAQ98_19125 [Blastocatellia bacterium]
MEKSSLFLKSFLALVISTFFFQVAFSQDSKTDVKNPIKFYGILVEVTPPNLKADTTNDLVDPQKPPQVIPKYERKISVKEKLNYGLNRAFLAPGRYIFPALNTIRQQTREPFPGKDTEDKVVDGFSRFAINYGNSSSRALLVSGVYPIIFKQNPYYQPSKDRNFGKRILHAASRVFVTNGDNGELQFNYSRTLGNFSAVALSNLWERNTPESNRVGVAPTFRRFRNRITFDVINFVVIKEFGPDLKKFFLRR